MEIKLSEISAMDDVRPKQINMAQNEFSRLDRELYSMIADLTLVQRQKVNEMIMDFIARQEMNK